MEVLLFAVPIALLISLLAVLAFIYQVKSGQFDDLETPPLRMLFDDVEVQKPAPADSTVDSTDALIPECVSEKSIAEQLVTETQAGHRPNGATKEKRTSAGE